VPSEEREALYVAEGELAALSVAAEGEPQTLGAVTGNSAEAGGVSLERK
jgi:hypothetical protein